MVLTGVGTGCSCLRIRSVESFCECGIEPPGSICHRISYISIKFCNCLCPACIFFNTMNFILTLFAWYTLMDKKINEDICRELEIFTITYKIEYCRNCYDHYSECFTGLVGYRP